MVLDRDWPRGRVERNLDRAIRGGRKYRSSLPNRMPGGFTPPVKSAQTAIILIKLPPTSTMSTIFDRIKVAKAVRPILQDNE